ncbi:phage tail tape measure protein [Cytobacillus purgationiresistens]|uniref:TP901 family phage tail tape measure protein n=1 Tax=Cytobacillus purgationiresistens TaxID=863449 RepID=A0ABU0AC92_9BACI|nr:phage tail tape measure protein [Cytobacillus purgationiresistens]MDQ0268871.1 TP901 family phage tail tape measure protein [Cytobacillus purgationiresistens]
MAKDIRVRLYSNSKQFNGEMSAISRQMKVVKADFEANRTSVTNWGNQLKQAQVKADFLTQKLALQRTRVKELEKAFNDSAAKKGKDAKETQNLAIRLKNATAEMNKIKNAITDTNQKMKQLGDQKHSKKLENDLKNLALQSKLIDSQFKAAKSSVDNFGNELKQTGLHAEQLNQKMKVQKQVVSTLENEYKRVARAKGKDSQETKQLAIRLNEARSSLNGMQNSLKQTTQRMKELDSATKNSRMSMQQLGDRLNTVGSNMREKGAAVAISTGIAFAALAAPIKKAVETTMEFDSSMSKVAAISGASAGELKKLDKQARDLGASTVFMSSQVSEGMQYLALAGWKTNDIMAAMPGMLDLAAAGALDLGRAADITSDVMSAFGLSAENAGHAADVFAFAQANANTNVEQMGEAMTYLAPVANALGWELEESAAATMSLANAGVKGSMAGQAFATSLSRLAKPTSAMKKEMKKLGMEFFDAEGNMKSLPNVMAEIEKGTKGMTKEQKSSTLSILFGAQAYKHWAILLEDGSKNLAKTTEELKNADGAAAKMAKTMMDNTRGKIIAFQSAVEGLQISLARQLTPELDKIVEKGTELVRWFTSLDEATQKTIAKTAVVSAGLLGVTAGVGALAMAIGGLLMFAGPVGLAITGGIAALGALGVATFAVKDHLKNLQKEQKKTKEETLLFGEGVSEGTKKAANSYVNLREKAEYQLFELTRTSGKEAKKMADNLINTYSEMSVALISELESMKTDMLAVLSSLYEDTGRKAEEIGQKMIDRMVGDIDADIQKSREMIKSLRELKEETGLISSEMSADQKKHFSEIMAFFDQSTMRFAANQKEAVAMFNAILSEQGNLSYKQAKKYYKDINEVYKSGQAAAKEDYEYRNSIIEKNFAQGYMEAEERNALLEKSTADYQKSLAKNTASYEDNLKALYQQMSKSGQLLDLETGKQFERQSEMLNGLNGFYGKIEETEQQYQERWAKKQIEYFAELGASKEEAMSQTQEALVGFYKGIGLTQSEAQAEAAKTVRAAQMELDANKEVSEKAGYGHGTSFYTGMGSVKGNTKKSALEIIQGMQSEFAKGKDVTQSHGRDKGMRHKTGLDSTKQMNDAASRALSERVTSTLGKTTDGGGGKKAGSEFVKGVNSNKGPASSASTSVAKTAESGLKNTNTSSIGSAFVSGFAGAIRVGSGSGGSVWSAAWNVGKSAISALKKAIDSNSPSKLTAEEGVNYTDGFALGIKKSTKTAVKSAVEMAKKTHGAFDTEINNQAWIISSAAKEIKAYRGDSSSNDSRQAVTSTENNYYFTYHSPKPIDPYESSRLAKQALREAALQV